MMFNESKLNKFTAVDNWWDTIL